MGRGAGHKKRCPPFSFYKGAKAAQNFRRVSGLIFLVWSSALLQAAWKFCKDRGAKKKKKCIPGDVACFHSPLLTNTCPFFSSLVPSLLFISRCPFCSYFLPQYRAKNSSARTIPLTDDNLRFNFLTDDLSYFCCCFFSELLLVTASYIFYLNL